MIDWTTLRVTLTGYVKRNFRFSTEDHEDITQETLLALYELASNNDKTPDDVIRLGHTIIKRRALDTLRAQKSHQTSRFSELHPEGDTDSVPLEDTLSGSMFGSTTTDPYELAQKRSFVDFLYQKLTADEKTLLSLDADGYSYDEIADTLSLSSKLVKSRIYDVRKKCERHRAEWENESNCVLTSKTHKS